MTKVKLNKMDNNLLNNRVKRPEWLKVKIRVDDDFNATHKKYQNVRKLSITVALNMGSYEGGDLQMILNHQKDPRTMRLEFGDVLVIPSTDFDEGVIGLNVHDAQTGLSTTPQVINFTHYDEPNTTSTVTYKVWASKSRSDNPTNHYSDKFYLNSTSFRVHKF